MSEPQPLDATSPASRRWHLIRDLAVFQLKLGLDALRDLVLSPVSLIAALVDLVFGGGQGARNFYAVLAAGRRTEAWINLFGELDRAEPRADAAEAAERASVDAIVDRMERLLVEQYERGGVTASAKTAIDRGLDAIGRRGPR